MSIIGKKRHFFTLIGLWGIITQKIHVGYMQKYTFSESLGCSLSIKALRNSMAKTDTIL